MRKQKQPTLIKSLEELISDHDRVDLVRALSLLKHDLSWQIIRAVLMKEYLNTVAYALDYTSKSGTQIEAAYSAGAAQTMYDTANSLIDKYIAVLEQKTAVTEYVRPITE